jgi:hypothetical protein
VAARRHGDGDGVDAVDEGIGIRVVGAGVPGTYLRRGRGLDIGHPRQPHPRHPRVDTGVNTTEVSHSHHADPQRASHEILAQIWTWVLNQLWFQDGSRIINKASFGRANSSRHFR